MLFSRMLEDRVLYCCGSPCTHNGLTMPADGYVRPDGQRWTLACTTCAQNSGIEIHPLDEEDREQVLATIKKGMSELVSRA